MTLLQEFRTFVARGNVLDLAVGVIIGAAFATITKSLTDDLIMPVIGWLFGGFDFSSYFIRLGPIPATYTGSPDNYAALKAAGVPLLVESPTNQQFPILPQEALDRLGEKFGFEYWQNMGDGLSAVRFCTSWATTDEAVAALIDAISKL